MSAPKEGSQFRLTRGQILLLVFGLLMIVVIVAGIGYILGSQKAGLSPQRIARSRVDVELGKGVSSERRSVARRSVEPGKGAAGEARSREVQKRDAAAKPGEGISGATESDKVEKAAKAAEETALFEKEAEPAREQPPEKKVALAGPGRKPKTEPGAPRATDEDGDYTVQVASFYKRGPAAALRDRYGSKGYPAYVVEKDLPGHGRVYRVRVGHFETLQSAQVYAREFERRERVRPWATHVNQ